MDAALILSKLLDHPAHARWRLVIGGQAIDGLSGEKNGSEMKQRDGKDCSFHRIQQPILAESAEVQKSLSLSVEFSESDLQFRKRCEERVAEFALRCVRGRVHPRHPEEEEARESTPPGRINSVHCRDTF